MLCLSSHSALPSHLNNQFELCQTFSVVGSASAEFKQADGQRALSSCSAISFRRVLDPGLVQYGQFSVLIKPNDDYSGRLNCSLVELERMSC
jgi:hypothetical protein